MKYLIEFAKNADICLLDPCFSFGVVLNNNRYIIDIIMNMNQLCDACQGKRASNRGPELFENKK